MQNKLLLFEDGKLDLQQLNQREREVYDRAWKECANDPKFVIKFILAMVGAFLMGGGAFWLITSN